MDFIHIVSALVKSVAVNSWSGRQFLLHLSINFSTIAVTLNNLRTVPNQNKSTAEEISFVKIDGDVATRDCTITSAFLTNSLSALLVSSEVGRSGQVSGDL